MSDWHPGVVFMETVVLDQSTLTQHRCWDAERFKQKRRDDAEHETARKDGTPTAVRFLSETDYRAKGGR